PPSHDNYSLVLNALKLEGFLLIVLDVCCDAQPWQQDETPCSKTTCDKRSTTI
ncbi:hypothetical protein ILYODFUR_037127, partial [Ilyodon furcidens]